MSLAQQARDRTARQRYLARSIWFTVPGTPLLILLAYTLLAPLAGMEQPLDRLLLALRWLPVAMLPYALVCLHIAYARFVEGSHDPLAGMESERLRIHIRVMQNTLEQLLWFVLCLLPLATLLAPAQAGLLPIACVFFGCARVLYWWGYLRAGTLGRAPGVQLTLTLNVGLLVYTMALLIRSASG